MDIKADRALRNEWEPETFESISEEEILLLWRTFKTTGLSAEEAWNAIVISMALDMAFARTQALKEVTQ